MFRRERLLPRPDGPDDPRQLVRDGYRRDIVPAPLLRRPCPELKRGRLSGALRVDEHGARAMDQKHAQVDVALLADRPEPATQRAGIFLRRQAQKTGKLPP